MKRRQLYRVASVELPYASSEAPGFTRTHFQKIPCLPIMYWPDGISCEAVTMYLMSIAHSVTGDTLRTYASELSHLVRHCGLKFLSFGDLKDGDIHQLADTLTKEKRPGSDELARNNNTTRKILLRSLRFLLWFQENLLPPFSPPIVGEAHESPRITIEWREARVDGKGKILYAHHLALPEPESRDPKRPIARPAIEALELRIDEISLIETQSSRFLQRFNASPHLAAAQLGYMRLRRHFLMWLMKRTGLRPSEASEISVEAHAKILKEKRLLLPTKKRRKLVAPTRNFPLELADANVFFRYLLGRDRYLRELRTAGVACEKSDSLFLGVDGHPIKKASLERDFSRLAFGAGLRNIKTCLSMFRHRFITLEVLVHLREFMSNTGKSKNTMVLEDYRAILKKVATKTGHGNPASLMRYIDFAWDEAKVWGTVEVALQRLTAADRLHEELRELEHEVRLGRRKNPSSLIQHIQMRLGEITRTSAIDLETLRSHGAKPLGDSNCAG